jgi:hypothetical protein
MTLKALEEAKGDIKGTKVEETRRKVAEIVSYYLGYMFATYGLEKMEHKTRMATNIKKAEKESELISKLMLKFPEATSKAFESMRADQASMAEIKKDATITKPLVMDTEKTLKEMESHYDTLDEAYTKSHEELTKKAAETIRRLVKQNLETAFTKSMEDTIRSAATRIRSYGIESLYGEHAVLDKRLKGFPGEVRLPQYKEEMTTQQRLFMEPSARRRIFAGGAGKGMLEEFKSASKIYSVALQEMAHKRESLKELIERRTIAGEEGYTDIWEKLDKQVKKSAEALDDMIEKLSKFGMIARQINDLSAAMNTLGDSLRSITIEQTVEAIPAMEKYRERMRGLYGGGGPDSLELVLPEQQRRAMAAGRTDIGTFASRKELEKMELEYKLKWEPPTGRAAHELQMQLKDLDEKYRRLELGEERGRETAKLRTELAPYEAYVKQLEKIRVAPTTTTGQSEAIRELQERIIQALGEASVEVSSKEMKKEAHKGFWWSGSTTWKEYRETLDKVEAAGERQFRGVPITKGKEFREEAFDIRKQYLKALEKAPTLDMEKMKISITDPLGEKLDEQTMVLRAIAEDMGIDASVIDKMVEAMKEAKTTRAEPSRFGRAIQWLRQLPYGKEEKAIGGRIFGAGGPREDKVPAMLSPGEYVIRAASAQNIGYGALEHMNKKGMVPGYGEGGIVDWFKKLKEKHVGKPEEVPLGTGAAEKTKQLILERKKQLEKMREELGWQKGGVIEDERFKNAISAITGKPLPTSEERMEGGKKLASILLDLIPGVGDIKSGQEAITGADILTGEKLGGLGRGLAGLAVLPFVPGVIKKFGKLKKAKTLVPKVSKLPSIKELTSTHIDEVTSIQDLNELMTKYLKTTFEFDKTANLSSSKKMAEVLRKEFTKVPQLRKLVDKITTSTELGKTVPASWLPSEKHMEFNLKHMSYEPEMFAKEVTKAAKKRKISPAAKLDPWMGVGSHEVGHVVQGALRKAETNAEMVLGGIQQGKLPKPSEQYLKTIKEIVIGGRKRRKLEEIGKTKKLISKYAGESEFEYFAEMYSTISILRDAPKELTRQLGISTDVLEQLVGFSKAVDPSSIRKVKVPKFGEFAKGSPGKSQKFLETMPEIEIPKLLKKQAPGLSETQQKAFKSRPMEEVPILLRKQAPGIPKRTKKEGAILAKIKETIPKSTLTPIEKQGVLIGGKKVEIDSILDEFGFKEGGIVDWFKKLKEKYLGKPEEAPIGTGGAEQTKRRIIERKKLLEEIEKELGWKNGDMFGKKAEEIPIMHDGGIKRTTGLAYLEKGEIVLPKQFAQGGIVNDELKSVMSIPTSAKSLNMKVEIDVTELKEIIEKGIEVNIDDTVKVGVDPGDVTVGIDPEAKVGIDPEAKVGIDPEAKVGVDTSGITAGVGAAENDALARVAESVEKVNNSLITVKRELEERIEMVSGVDELTINRMISEAEGKIQTELNNDVKTNIDDLRRELIQQRQISDYNVEELKYLINVVKTKVG